MSYGDSDNSLSPEQKAALRSLGVGRERAFTDTSERTPFATPDYERGSAREIAYESKPFGIEKVPEISDDDLEEIAFQEQCVLLEHFEPIVKENFTTVYDYFSIVHGPPGSITNTIHSRTDIQPFWNITPEQLSHLQPTVRLFKVRYDRNGEEIDAVEFPFSERILQKDLDDITNTKVSRGSGVNLVNFDWKLRGTNPAEATNVIECSLTFRFESLQDLDARRDTIGKDGNPTEISFIELFSFPPKKIKEEGTDRTVFNPDYFTFRAIVGWADLDGAHNRKDLRELNRILKEDQRVFSLTMANHDLQFSQEGPVNLTIHAIARLDAISHISESDIFNHYRSSVDSEFNRYKERQAELKKMQGCLGDKPSETEEERLEKEKKEVKEILERVELEKVKMWSLFLQEAIDKDRIYSIAIPKDDIRAAYDRSYFNALVKAQSAGNNDEVINRQIMAEMRSKDVRNRKIEVKKYEGSVFSNISVRQGETDKVRDEVREGNKKETSAKFKNGQYTIPFIYLGDIFDTALRALHGDDNSLTDDSSKTLIGDIVLFDPREGKRYSVNLADIPISVTLFQEWFIEHVHGSKKGDRWAVKVFIKDVIETLLIPALQPEGCFVKVPQRAIKISTTYFTTDKKKGDDPLDIAGCNRIVLDKLKELPKPRSPHGEDIMEYWLIYAGESFPAGEIADFEQDWERGIYHFMIGRDRGLVKEINFSRVDMPHLREARIVAEGESLFDRLRERYTAEIPMVGNNLFVPGDAIFVNPSTIVFGNHKSHNSLGQVLGLIGYYRIIEVDSYIEAGEYRTTLKALWEAAGDGHSRSVSEKAITKNRLCKSSKDVVEVGEDISLREVYSRDEVVRIQPGTNSNYCFEVQTAGSPRRAEAQRRAASGGFVPR